jgi:hypothetical protein
VDFIKKTEALKKPEDDDVSGQVRNGSYILSGWGFPLARPRSTYGVKIVRRLVSSNSASLAGAIRSGRSARALEEQIAAKVRCPLHGDRFKPIFHIYVPKWRRENEKEVRWFRLRISQGVARQLPARPLARRGGGR